MKRSILSGIILLFAVSMLALTLAGCEKEKKEKEDPHIASAEWLCDETYHWHKCTEENCELEHDKAEHRFTYSNNCEDCLYNCSEGLDLTLENDEYTVSKYTGFSEIIVIPTKCTGC